VGASATFSIVIEVIPTTPSGATITNTASASTTTLDSNPDNNSAPATTTVVINASADLSATISAPATVDAGGNITYQVSVTNNGPDTAQYVGVGVFIPTNTTFVSERTAGGPNISCPQAPTGGGGGDIFLNCTLRQLNKGATASMSVVVNVNITTPTGTQIVGSVGCSSVMPDPDMSNNEPAVSTYVN